jgi:hypothetical protein
MSEEEGFIKNFKNQVSENKSGYIDSYIEKNHNTDPAEADKANKIKTVHALNEFIKDNFVD